MKKQIQTDIIVIGNSLEASISAGLEARESRGTHYLIEDAE